MNAGGALVGPFVGMYVLISRRGGEETLGIGGGSGFGLEGRGGRSMADLIEFRLLLLNMLGGDFMENPDSVLPRVLFTLFDLVLPSRLGVPS